MLLLDLENCDAGYCPTGWQRSRFPGVFQDKLATIFDGIETDIWRPLKDDHGPIPGLEIPDDRRLVTYVSRGLESMRGFDVFMRAAKRLCDERKDVVFLVIGEDRVAYGGDLRYTEGQTFKQWVLGQDSYDLSRIKFPGRVPPPVLARLLNRSDLHIYLTVPFVLSWSLMNALACGATVMASRTPPVEEMIQHEKNGLLFDFFDVDDLVSQAHQVLDAPQDYRHLGEAGVEMIRNEYSLEVCLPQIVELYNKVLRV
jgi:glycosyltransferase involved in cell wall biosynthesis